MMTNNITHTYIASINTINGKQRDLRRAWSIHAYIYQYNGKQHAYA